jgi:hypothetical protein
MICCYAEWSNMALRVWRKSLVLLAVFCVPVFLSPAESAGSDEDGSVYAALRKWIAAETAIGIYRAWPGDAGNGTLQEAALIAIEETAEAVRAFKRGYQYYAYSLTSFSHEVRIDDILSLLEDTAAAVRAGKPLQAAQSGEASYPKDTPPPEEAVRDAIIAWQRYDTALVNSIQLNYVYQNGIFIITIWRWYAS